MDHQKWLFLLPQVYTISKCHKRSWKICKRMNQIWFWSFQFVLDGSKVFWTRFYAYFGQVQNALDLFKLCLGLTKTNWIRPKQIGLTKIVLDLSIEGQGNSVLAPLYDHKLQNGVYFDYHQTLNLYADTGIPSNTVLSWKYARCIIWQYINCVSQH